MSTQANSDNDRIAKRTVSKENTDNILDLIQEMEDRSSGVAGQYKALFHNIEKSAADMLGMATYWKRHTQPSLIGMVEKGLPINVVLKLAGHLNIPEREFAQNFLAMSQSTITRRKKEKRLSTEESDRAVRYARLLVQATDLMRGDENAARRWLDQPRKVLSGNSPLEHARTEAGGREVEGLIERIRDGVFT